MSNKFLDRDIYNKAKKLADKKYEKHSAYKSMYLVEEYERLGGRINKNLKKSGTATWNKEKWKNLTPIAMGIESKIKNLTPCGEKHPKQKTNPTNLNMNVVILLLNKKRFLVYVDLLRK